MEIFPKWQKITQIHSRLALPSWWMWQDPCVSRATIKPRMWSCRPPRMEIFWPSTTPGPTPCPCTAGAVTTSTRYSFDCIILNVRFNSIRASPVYGIRRKEADIQFVCFKLRETVEECLQFWGLEEKNIV